MNYQKLYECLFCAVRTAGIVANMMQATIVNEGKQVEVVEDEDERHLRMREAKTRADEIVQEILLQSLLPEYQAVLSLDVEEDTVSRTCFLKQDYDYTLVLELWTICTRRIPGQSAVPFFMSMMSVWLLSIFQSVISCTRMWKGLAAGYIIG